MLQIRYAYIFFTLTVTTSFSFGQTASYDPNRQYAVDTLKSDMHFLMKKMEGIHPSLYRYTPKPEFEAFFDSLDHTINRPMNEQELLSLVTLLNEKIDDGHTMFLPSTAATEYNNTKGRFIPLSVVCVGGKLYITENCSKDSNIQAGEELLEINGVVADDVMAQLIRRMMRDAHNLNYPLWTLNHYFTAFYSFAFGQPSRFSLKIKNSFGRSYFVQIDALPKDSIRIIRKLRYADKYPITIAGRGITLEENSQTRVAILTIKSFDPDLINSMYKQDFNQEMDSAFVALKRHHIQDLILDLRDNQGGDFEQGRYLLSYLLVTPSLYLLSGKESRLIRLKANRFSGGLSVLINGGSFSNTVIVSSILEREKRAIFIGEETGGNKHIINGKADEWVLPHTGIRCNISTSTFLIRPGPNDGHGIVPGYPIHSTIADILTQRDITKELAIKMFAEHLIMTQSPP